jgi:hypothetical protein
VRAPETPVNIVAMPLTDDDVRRIINEDNRAILETRRHLPPDPAVARVLSSFANTNGGILIVGADDEGDIFGLSEVEAQFVAERLNEIATSLLPGRHDISVVTVEGRKLVYVKVEPTPSELGFVSTARGKIYTRHDQEVVKLKPRHINVARTERTLTVFVAMSFREEEDPALIDYWAAMQRAAEGSGVPLLLLRIDLKEGDFEISQAILDAIDHADIVIADFTLSSRNVYFELGYARGTRKRLIQTARKDTVLDFDVRNWRTIFYRNATELEQKLCPALLAAYDELTAG